jgi:hypothetical protein
MKSICFPPSAFCLLSTAYCVWGDFELMGLFAPTAARYWCHLRDMGVASRSHSRESGNLLGKPSEMRCRRTGLPLSRE